MVAGGESPMAHPTAPVKLRQRRQLDLPMLAMAFRMRRWCRVAVPAEWRPGEAYMAGGVRTVSIR